MPLDSPDKGKHLQDNAKRNKGKEKVTFEHYIS